VTAPSVFWNRYPTARKIHACCECDKAINTGDQYRRASGVWDGEFAEYKQCLRCANVMEALSLEAIDPESEPLFGEVLDLLRTRTRSRSRDKEVSA
jgi:hypothetical protein